MYRGIVRRKNIREIHREIKSVTEFQVSHKLPYDKKQEMYCLNLAKKAVKNISVNQYTNEELIDFGFFFLKKEDSFHKMKNISYENGVNYEAKAKEELLKNQVVENQKEAVETPKDDTNEIDREMDFKIFYLASSHNDCADDHLDWQGKMYYDKYWKRYVKNEVVRNKVEEYIRNNNCKTYQWVTNRPVWFISRPNCRHYFKVLPIKVVFSREVNKLIADYKLHSKIGHRPTQTISHSTKKEWYTKENIEGIIKKYQERLAYHEALYSVHKSQIIKMAIEKDKMLIKKWEKYLQSKIN